MFGERDTRRLRTTRPVRSVFGRWRRAGRDHRQPSRAGAPPL